MEDNGTPDREAARFTREGDLSSVDSRQSSPGKCEVCGNAIHPSNAKCSECASTEQSGGESATVSWSFDRLALAVVPAHTRAHAAAIAAAAFKTRSTTSTEDENHDLFFNLDSPSDTLSKQWDCDILDAATLSEAEGLLEAACAQIDWELTADSAGYAIQGDQVTTAEARFFSETDALTEPSRVQDLLRKEPDDSMQLYVVPGVLYADTRPDDSAPVVEKGCPRCGHVGEHRYDGHPIIDGIERRQRGEYKCLNCGVKNVSAVPDKLPTYRR
jgi:predicted nucleic acid-binding Zn ribbon protein